jgi:hypothetical protein
MSFFAPPPARIARGGERLWVGGRAARGPSHPPRPGVVDTLAVVEAR